MDAEASEGVAVAVREELARRRLSRQWLADEARLSISTLEKALAGRRPFTLGTVVRLEEALGIRLRPKSAPAVSQAAPEHMGAYARPAVKWLEGEYLTLRASFADPAAIYAYRTLIEWDHAQGHLHFEESDRIDCDFTQKGYVAFPTLSGHIYLVTISSGQHRLVLLSRPSAGRALNGLLLTLAAGRGGQLAPAATPIALISTGALREPDLGVIEEGHACYERYRDCLRNVTEGGYVTLGS